MGGEQSKERFGLTNLCSPSSKASAEGCLPSNGSASTNAHTPSPRHDPSSTKENGDSAKSPFADDGWQPDSVEADGKDDSGPIVNSLDRRNSLDGGGARHVPDEDGRIHYTNEDVKEPIIEDPFLGFFRWIDHIQELALPLLLGVLVGMICSNSPSIQSDYDYYFRGLDCTPEDPCAKAHRMLGASGSAPYDCDPCANSAHRMLLEDAHRMLGSAPATDCRRLLDDFTEAHRILGGGGATIEDCPRWILFPCPIFGYPVTLHFFANDLLMVGHFGLAMKELTEAFLPGGSINPPSKAINPLLTTIGGALGPIGVYFLLLHFFVLGGFFNRELDMA
jgi:hypothetical protein